MIDFAKLAAPFPPHRVSWRVGSTSGDKKRGMALAYIDARDVMERLDEVCGPAGWQCTYPHANGKTVCSIGIKVGAGQAMGGGFDPGEWVWKSDGAGDTDFEAEKGALSDAFKRAAVRWGVGRYLYDTAAPWVDIEPMGKSYKIADHEVSKLMKALGAPAVPATAETAPIADRIIADLMRDIVRQSDAATFRTWWADRVKKIPPGSLTTDEFEAVKNAAVKRARELEKGLETV